MHYIVWYLHIKITKNNVLQYTKIDNRYMYIFICNTINIYVIKYLYVLICLAISFIIIISIQTPSTFLTLSVYSL